MIQKHIQSNLKDYETIVDEIGEKHIASGRQMNGSPPVINMGGTMQLFHKSSPIKDLRFFESDLNNNKVGLNRYK